MTTPLSSIVHVLPDKIGGHMTVVSNLVRHRTAPDVQHHAIMVHQQLSRDDRFGTPLEGATHSLFEHNLPLENLVSVLRRLAALIPDVPGPLVSHDWLELALLYRFSTRRTVFQILHGDDDYYYDLAVRHDAFIDAYVALSRAIDRRLRSLLPHRSERIFYLPFGVPVPKARRSPAPGRLRCVYAGRLENEQKGIFDLPEIDAKLKRRGVVVDWTIIGGGPHAEQLRARWHSHANVVWHGMLPNSAVPQALLAQDVFVLPTRREGLPVALLEAMSLGLVPVVSNIPSGVPDIVQDHQTGFLPPVGDAEAFASAIAHLDANRLQLEELSRRCRELVSSEFDARSRTRKYENLFLRSAELYRAKPLGVRSPYGSRLDRPWIPNAVVKLVRNRLHGDRYAHLQPRASGRK